MHKELAARGIHFIDAPVSGGPLGADAGTIAIMAGAPQHLFARVEPVLRSISSNVFHVGEVGAGHVMKVANNLPAAAQRAMTHEVMCLAVKNGVDPAVAVKVLQSGSCQNYTLNNTYPRHILPGKLFQGFTLALMHKDVTLANDLGGCDAGRATPCGRLTKRRWRESPLACLATWPAPQHAPDEASRPDLSALRAQAGAAQQS